ncbi:unnamed protein product, partial [Phaeothamnion confervicola]
PEAITFGVYSHQQLLSILAARVGDIAEAKVLEWCCRRLENNTGDARTALAVCAEAIAMARAERRPA